MKWWFIAFVFLISCGGNSEDLCSKYNTLYPDLVSGRVATRTNVFLVRGCQHYAAGEFTDAVAVLSQHTEIYKKEPTAYLYKAVSQLQLNKPFEAELTLDQLEALQDKSYSDQIDYYNLVALICSNQHERALALAKEIRIAKPRHTYTAEMIDMMDDLAKEI